MPTPHPLLYALAGVLVLGAPGARAGDALWRDAPAIQAGASARGAGLPASARRVILDSGAFEGAMRHLRRSASSPSIELPLPSGGSSEFRLESSGAIPPGLAARYPGLQSMKGEDAQGRRVRIDIGPNGIDAAVSDADGDWLIRPEIPERPAARSADRYHAVFRRAAATRRPYSEDAAPDEAGAHAKGQASARKAEPRVYRTFRIAMTATPSYTQALGGTTEQALQGMAATVNRVNRIYERDFGVHLVLVEDSDKLVFTRNGPDPFGDLKADDPDYDWNIAMRNVEVVARVLDDDAFDVGHVLDAQRDAGIAGAIGNTCRRWTGNAEDRGQSKAAGMTGSTQPFGDPFHVDFVAHELGHQFGANHTFNGCVRGWQASAGTEFEPGSGSTVMGYAGLCGSHDLQRNADDYFHGASIDQVMAWVSAEGGACAATGPIRARTPWLDTEGWQQPMAVPARTPFRLSGLAQFADRDAKLSYTFEQMDLGDPQGRSDDLSDRGNGPLFRSRKPVDTGEQTFPAMAVLLGEEILGLGDALPASSRDLRFRMTVRDEREGLRSPAVSAERTVKVVDTGRAFAITAPAAYATLRRGKPRLLRWNIAGTTKAPIACPSVRIDLSVDGGHTFLEAPLAREVPNRGRATVDVPADVASSGNARLRVACADGRFFALSPPVQVR